MTVLKDTAGPDFPLGLIVVTAPGTPVAITSLIDPTNLDHPNTSNRTGAKLEYGSVRFQQLMFQGFKAGAVHGLQPNAGNVYIIRSTGDYDDPGVMVAVLAPGQTIWIASAPSVRNVISPYRYRIDADSANDGALVTGWSV